MINKLIHSIILGNQGMDSRCANTHEPTATLYLDSYNENSVTLPILFFKSSLLPSTPTEMNEVTAAEELLVPSKSHIIVFAKLTI